MYDIPSIIVPRPCPKDDVSRSLQSGIDVVHFQCQLPTHTTLEPNEGSIRRLETHGRAIFGSVYRLVADLALDRPPDVQGASLQQEQGFFGQQPLSSSFVRSYRLEVL